jgi:glyoxylase-like metal-dependent hydrolase (beta-lactamase superfamily II)
MAVLLISAGGCREKKEVTFNSPNFELVKLADGVYGCIHKFGGRAICNVGIVDNGQETMVFDTFLDPGVATELIDVAEQLGLSPIKYVVNSHAHNDHIRGNQVFAGDVKIISTNRTAQLINAWEPEEIAAEKEYAPQRLAHYDSLYKAYTGDTTAREYLDILMWKPYYEVLAESHNVIRTRLPEIFVDDEQSFDGPKRRLQLITKGAGHTESDLVLYLPDDKILFSGDLVFNECHPYLAHGSLTGLKNWLDFIDDLDVETVVPGHGPVGPKEVITTMKSYVHTIEELASEMHKYDISPRETEGMNIPSPYDDWWFEQFFLSNLRFAYTTSQKN